jgi:Phage terminase large subunit (GpA)
VTDTDDYEIPDYASDRERDVVVGIWEMGDAILSSLGSGGSPIDAEANSYEFAKKYDLRIDKQRITGPRGLDGDYKHLKYWYEDEHRFQVGMAAGQTGKTARLMVKLSRTAYKEAFGRLIGYYFPDKHLPTAFSTERFKPFLKSNPELAATLGRTVAGERGKDSTLTVNVSDTTLYFMTIGGKTATEGLPLKAVFFDEVRRMKIGDIERAQMRYNAQTEPIDFKVSTAKYPKGDIHKYFLESDQRYFHTGCSCSSGVVLSTTFPDCIADLRNATSKLKRKVAHAFSTAGLPYLGMTESDRAQFPEAAYICPKCGEILVDPREGWWEPHAEAYVHGYQLPQMITVTNPAGKILQAFEHAEDIQEFHNSTLGLPFVDKDKMPIQEEDIDACVDKSLVWGEHMSDDQRRKKIVNSAMGIDVQAGYALAVVKTKSASGKSRVVHIEVLRPSGPGKIWWERAGKLMKRYDVRLCVIDEAPEFSESLAFAESFRGRVFLANFGLGDNAPRMVSWDDEALADDTKQKGSETPSRYRVSMQRTKTMHWALMRWKNRHNEIPNLQTLTQRMPLDSSGQPVFSAHLRVGTEGVASMGMILREQLTVWVFRDVYEDPDMPAKSRKEKKARGEKRWVAEFVGGQSPDLAMANLYADVALDRIGSPFGVRGLG